MNGGLNEFVVELQLVLLTELMIKSVGVSELVKYCEVVTC